MPADGRAMSIDGSDLENLPVADRPGGTRGFFLLRRRAGRRQPLLPISQRGGAQMSDWYTNEEAVLRLLYADTPMPHLAKILWRHSASSIMRRAQYLGLRRRKVEAEQR